MTYIPAKGYEDSFGKLISDGVTLLGERPSHYDFDPERLRVAYATATGSFSRRFIQYGDNANFTDGVDDYQLSPATGDVMKLETAERFRYVPQNTMVPSFAFELNQALATGDKATIAFGDADLDNSMAAADGWILEMKPSLATNEAHFNMYRNGSIVSNNGSDNLVTFENSYLLWRRLAMWLNWYSVGNSLLEETFTNSGEQLNPFVSKISNDGGRGPQTGNKKLQFAIKSGGNGTNLQIGTHAVTVLTRSENRYREKGITRRLTGVLGSGSWEPLIAYRIDPNRDLIAASWQVLSILDFSATDLVRLQVQAFSPEKVTFDNTDSWGIPPELSSTNSAIQERNDPAKFTLSTGNVTSSGDDIGGFQLGSDAVNVDSSGPGGNTEQLASSGRSTVKRPMYSDDVIFVLGKSASSGDIIFNEQFREER